MRLVIPSDTHLPGLHRNSLWHGTILIASCEAPRPQGGASRIGINRNPLALLDPALKARGLRSAPGHQRYHGDLSSPRGYAPRPAVKAPSLIRPFPVYRGYPVAGISE